MTEPLTSEDLASVAAVQDELVRGGWTVRWSINQVVDGWTSLVVQIERGYDGCVYELTNDLSVRECAERMVELASPRVAGLLTEHLSRPDERYRAATRALDRSLRGSSERWWLQRVPNVLAGELARDLVELGFIDPA